MASIGKGGGGGAVGGMEIWPITVILGQLDQVGYRSFNLGQRMQSYSVQPLKVPLEKTFCYKHLQINIFKSSHPPVGMRGTPGLRGPEARQGWKFKSERAVSPCFALGLNVIICVLMQLNVFHLNSFDCCLHQSVCLLISRITQKLLDRFPQNIVERCGVIQGRIH